MNKQEPEKSIIASTGPKLEVHSIFHTIQGEGPYSGERATFIRLAGCNLKCPMCDTDYTSKRESMFVQDIVDQCGNGTSAYAELVVITGGEPFRQNLSFLCDMLINNLHRIQIESNGTLPPSPNLDKRVEVVCSPKTGSINRMLHPYIVAYKYVIPPHSREYVNSEDGLPITALDLNIPKMLARPHDGSLPVYITPESHDIGDNPLPSAAAAVVDSAKMHGHIAQCQLHKYLGVE